MSSLLSVVSEGCDVCSPWSRPFLMVERVAPEALQLEERVCMGVAEVAAVPGTARGMPEDQSRMVARSNKRAQGTAFQCSLLVCPMRSDNRPTGCLLRDMNDCRVEPPGRSGTSSYHDGRQLKLRSMSAAYHNAYYDYSAHIDVVAQGP
jgi:hypothetical protein